MSKDDEYYMQVALNMGRRGVGRVAPNPSVGCVIVKNGVMVGRGRTAEGGRPHAEAAALAHAGVAARGGTAYVTLEPCAVAGRAGPCADALVQAGVKRVVVACHDINPAVYKKGIEVLEGQGVEVSFGLLESEAHKMHEGFFLKHEQGRPFVTCKVGLSQDGKIAAAEGARTQISGKMAQRHMHLQRSRHDAILIGSETYIADAPKLTTRLEGLNHQALRFVLDRRGRIDAADGFEILRHDTIQEALEYLTMTHGVTRLLVEGGTQIHKAFLAADMVDEFQLCHSPDKLGEAGVDGIRADEISAASKLVLQKTRQLGEDRLEIYGRAH